MSILGSHSSGNNTSAPFFHEFKKQASFFFKEKIKTARLALTDVTPAELLTEEATNGNPWAPDARTLKIISKSAFEVDDYWRIVGILHKKLERFDKKNWRPSYKALIVLEHLLTQGPESVPQEFQSDRDAIREMECFQHIDEKGFNWGQSVRKKSERIMKLLEKGPLLKEERNRARKLTRGIEGFGSFCHRTTSAPGISRRALGRSNSEFNHHEDEEDSRLLFPDNKNLTRTNDVNLVSVKKLQNVDLKDESSVVHKDPDDSLSRGSSKENTTTEGDVQSDGLHKWSFTGESKSLLAGDDDDDDFGRGIIVEGHHPFNDNEYLTDASLLSTRDKILQAC